MEEYKVVLVNPWWHDPLLIAAVSAILTGFIFAFALRLHSRWLAKKDILQSLKSELIGNYNVIKKIQGMSKVKGLEKNDRGAAALRRDMPWKKDLSDEEITLDMLKNRSIDQEISIECWAKFQSELAKYPKVYPKYVEAYSILNRLIKFSIIKSQGMKKIDTAEKAAIFRFDAIRLNSEDFIKKYEEYF